MISILFGKLVNTTFGEVCNDSQLPESICVKIEKLIPFINNALFICSETYWIEKLKDEDSDEYYYDDY